jgi:hypothetical protein
MAICLTERDLRRIEQDLMKKLGEGERKTGHGVPKGVRIDVWEKYVGKNKYEGKCYVCDERLISRILKLDIIRLLLRVVLTE